MLTLAPVIVFVYNRPEHTKMTLTSLMQNHLADQSTLIIYADGPKTQASEEQLDTINKVREIIREEKWCKEIYIIESDINKGLSLSVREGVTETLNKYGKVIVLEDDLVSDKWFLKFMNDSLTLYENEHSVACISGYIYPVKEKLPETFFLKGADCWGWATWKRAWNLLDTNGEKLLKELEEKKLTFDFNFYDTYPYIQMLKDQIAKKNNSWAILWYASAYLNNAFTLYPAHSLINNIGIDGSGTHSGTSTQFDVILLDRELIPKKIPVHENEKAKKIISNYFFSIHHHEKNSYFKRVLKRFIK